MIVLSKEPPGGFCYVGCCVVFHNWRFFVLGLLFYATSTPPWLLRTLKTSTGSELYPGYFQFLLLPGSSITSLSHFIASATVFSGLLLRTGAFYLALLHTFWHICDSDASRNTLSRIFLYECSHRDGRNQFFGRNWAQKPPN